MKKSEKTINEIRKLITSLTDKDFEELQEMAEEQANYIHPLIILKSGLYNII